MVVLRQVTTLLTACLLVAVSAVAAVDPSMIAPDAAHAPVAAGAAFSPLAAPGWTAPAAPACADDGADSVVFPASASAAAAPGCDPYDWAAYTHLGDGAFPNDYSGCGEWKYASCQTGNPALDNDPSELFGVTGMSIDAAWRLETGRPDVVVAVIDSGIKWDERDLIEKAYLNLGELAPAVGGPKGSPYADYDTDGDGVVSARDWEGVVAPDAGPNTVGGAATFLDPQDIIFHYSDGVDDDGNGFIDDISGWNFLDDDNDPWDEVRYGHGTGEAKGMGAQAGNGFGTPGVCPNCRVLHMRQGQSFLAHSENYAQSVLFAVDSGASIIQSALGSIDANTFTRHAHEYAFQNGVAIVASAADEAAGHHNMPTNLLHAMNFNSIRPLDVAPGEVSGYLHLNGCTNFMATITATVSSTSCSSEATERAAGIVGLMLSHAVDTGKTAAHAPKGLSPNEVKQIITTSADDIDKSARQPMLAQPWPSKSYDSQPGYDQYFGYGRLNAANAVWAVNQGDIPPEAEIQSPLWWSQVDGIGEPVSITALTGAARTSTGDHAWELAWGCGAQPLEEAFQVLATGAAGDRQNGRHLANWDPIASGAFVCAGLRVGDPTNHQAITLRLRVTDEAGRVGEDRVPLGIDIDATRHALADTDGGMASSESSTMAHDLDGDGLPELLVPSSDGIIRALSADGSSVPGWPVAMDDLAAHVGQPSFATGVVPVPAQTLAPSGLTIADIDGDGTAEILASSLDGFAYAWHADGSRVAGWPVSADPTRSAKVLRYNDYAVMPGFFSRPATGDIDGDGDTEIVQGGLDGHVYAWHHDATPVAGFPYRVIDRDTVTTTLHPSGVEWVTEADFRAAGSFRGGKIVSQPVLADLDGDGADDIIVGSNDHYREEPNWAATEPILSSLAIANEYAGLLDMGNGRLFAVSLKDGAAADLPGWPVPIGLLLAEILPYVGEGVPGGPVVTDIDGDGSPEVAIFSVGGPVYVLNADGTGFYGEADGKPIVLSTVAKGPGATMVDSPYFPAVGSSVVGDLEGDGIPDLVAPVAGLGRLLDVLLTGEQLNSEDGVMAYDLLTGAPKAGFPRAMEDLQFITTHKIADVDGDGLNEVIAGSGTSVVHAFKLGGGEPLGWPKVTGNWMIGTASVADHDGDGHNEVAVTTREGNLFVWSTVPAVLS